MYKIATIHVSGVEARVVDLKKIPLNITGASVIFIYDDPMWAGLTKNVVFDGSETVSILNAGEVVQFPPEVAGAVNQNIRVGVCGTNAEGTVIIPTIWADMGAVRSSAYGHFPPPAEKHLPVWAQLQSMIGDLTNLNTVDKSNLVAAVNEVMRNSGGGNGETAGGYYTPSVTQPTSNTMKISFVPSMATMPAVEPVTIKLPGSDSGQNVTIDSTLTQSGKAADAKATGDEIKRVESKIPSLDGYAKEEDIPASPDDIGAQPKGDYLTEAPVTTVNGKTGAVVLGAADVGARPDTWVPTAQEVGALPDTYVPPTQTAEQVGADPKGTAASAVSAHNISGDAHNDIRLLIQGLTTRLNALANSTDTDLDQMAELVAYIKSNKSLIDGITTSKVSVSDIVDNLTTNVANKPLSAAQGVALKALIDGLSTGKLDASKLQEAVNTALAQAKASGEFDGADGQDGNPGAAATFEITGATALAYGAAPTVTEQSGSTAQARKYKIGIPVGPPGEKGGPGLPGTDGYTPVRGVDYYTEADKSEFSEYIASELAKRGQLKPEFANSIEECTDTSKLYVLPDGYIYAYMLTEVESGPTYTNVLPTAINSDGTPYVGTNGEKGYKTGWRLNSSRIEKEADNRCCTGFIPVKHTDSIRFKNIQNPADGSMNGYLFFYKNDFTNDAGMAYEFAGLWDYVIIPSQLTSVASTGTNATENVAYMRISTSVIDDTSVITINEEIVEGGGTTTEYAWANTGHAFVPADYEGRIVDLETLTEDHTAEIEKLKAGITDSTTAIKEWDAPIYDANIPVFQLSAEKAAMTNATNTPDAIYAMYDALMTKHPRYITKTDLGLCSDGVNHVYRYDFREPDPHYESGKVWSETKAKAILMTGVHFEWAGIYSLYYALEEIADNPELRNFRRNVHLIVVPVANPYATIGNNYQSGLSTPNSYGVRNANGVEIHRNFEVDWVLTEEGSTHYGGPAPLSEVETQYIDEIMRNNTDAALFLSAHNCGVESVWGTGFIWSSTATKYMCNMGFRLVDKMSDAWMDKYGDVLSAGIEEYKTDALEDGDTRLGWAGLSTSPGTEAKQATKYGIQGTNIETCDPFQIHGTKANPEPSMSAFTMSRGAEVYINFLLTAFGVYDPKDKQQYA